MLRKAAPVEVDWSAPRDQLFDQPGQRARLAERAQRIDAAAREMAWPRLAAMAQCPLASRAELQRRLDEAIVVGHLTGQGRQASRLAAPRVRLA